VKHAVCIASTVGFIGIWFQRAPHWMIPLGALALGTWGMSRRWFWGGVTVFGLYMAVWAVTPVDTHRAFQVSVLRMPVMDCAKYDRCADGAIEWSHGVYGEDVDK
jgi:hypothetical protein